MFSGLSGLFKENTSESSCSEESAEESSEKSAEESAEKSAEESAEKSAEESAEKSAEKSSEKSAEDQTEDSCAEDMAASEAPQVLEEEQEETDVADILEKCFNATELKRKEYKLPKIRRKYTFKQSIKNLHIGKPAYSCADMSPAENTKSTMMVEDRSSGTEDLCLSGGKLRGSGEESSPHWKKEGRQKASAHVDFK